MPLDEKRAKKLALFCGVQENRVFSAPDAPSIYEVPLTFEDQHLSDAVLDYFHMKAKAWDKSSWQEMVDMIHNNREEVVIGIVGKYFATGDYNLEDAYASVIESIKHAAWHAGLKPVIKWINAESVEKDATILDGLDGIIVPGGFGERGVEGKIRAVQYARENKVPYLGLCYGLHMAVIEFGRHVLGMSDAQTTEINPDSTHPVIHIMPDQEKKLLKKDYGASMRLGAWECALKDGSIVRQAYGQDLISERHRHRYEVNNEFVDQFEKSGFIVSGTSPDGKLVEIMELKKSLHPFFVGVQFHPEMKSRPLQPHPLFYGLVTAAKSGKRA